MEFSCLRKGNQGRNTNPWVGGWVGEGVNRALNVSSQGEGQVETPEGGWVVLEEAGQ